MIVQGRGAALCVGVVRVLGLWSSLPPPHPPPTPPMPHLEHAQMAHGGLVLLCPGHLQEAQTHMLEGAHVCRTVHNAFFTVAA